MKIWGLLPLGLSLASSAVLVWILNADFTAQGISYNIGTSLLGSFVTGIVALLLGGIGFGALRLAGNWGETVSIIAFAIIAFFFLIFFNAVAMSYGLGAKGVVVPQGIFFWQPLGASLGQVVFSAWLSKYLN